jgi:hypothetical protein
MRIVKALQTEAKGADYLVLWLDCDREGGACVQQLRPCGQGRAFCIPQSMTMESRQRLVILIVWHIHLVE